MGKTRRKRQLSESAPVLPRKDAQKGKKQLKQTDENEPMPDITKAADSLIQSIQND